ncbi:efflux RND transporter periplasmic adaptor subunit [Maledivibacter halophilus]|uniref:Membrane fusion protein, macrolide-specific efflux system n=1 Tax=Maledivibacter halophilus TaxID=36842 RepID=A0A1T5J7M1_9FIRM|nr:efflux RND transporter periplasmic adaptor subunit [Maledivibacter halophilus]SKC47411.1 membrane fusion protein, macrolide-specific efflux system [Maledivibacter halophilus]
MVKKFASNKLIKTVLVLVLIACAGFVGFKYVNKPAESLSKDTLQKEEKVKKDDITIGFEGDGEAEIPVVNLDFDISGKLKELYVSEGEAITEGQLLAKLNDIEYSKKLKTAEINYTKALANLEQKKENRKLSLISEKQKLEELKSNLDQVESEYLLMLEIQDVYSKQELDVKKSSYENAKLAYQTQLERYNILSSSTTDIELEKANVESSKLSLDMAKDDYNSTILKSPMEGRILNIAYKPGETVSSGDNSDKVTADTSHFMVVSDADKVEVVVPVSEIDLSKVEIGQRVELEFEAFEGQKFTGNVIKIDSLPMIDNNGIVTFNVRAQLDGGVDKIKSGMTCSVEFIIKQRKDVLVIPNKAVSMVEGKQIVKVKDESGNIETKNIKTGLTDGKFVEVIEGINVGETIIIEEKKAE